MVYVLALAVTAVIFAFGGLSGLIIAALMILLFELMYKRVHGKSIAQITREDFFDHQGH